MNREIKFRVWNKSTKEMLPDRDGSGSPWAIMAMLHSDRYDLMQYTGLKDSDGREIYEGDILLSRIGIKYPITFNVLLGRFQGVKNNILLLGQRFADCKIIGNIHQNPELL